MNHGKPLSLPKLGLILKDIFPPPDPSLSITYTYLFAPTIIAPCILPPHFNYIFFFT